MAKNHATITPVPKQTDTSSIQYFHSASGTYRTEEELREVLRIANELRFGKRVTYVSLGFKRVSK